MKKFVLAVAAVLICGTVLAQTEVYSVNVVGFQKITVISNGLTFGSMPFDVQNNALSNVVRSGLQGGTGLLTGDNLYKWDVVTQRYVKCWLKTLDGNWHRDTTGNPVATNVFLSPGEGYIIVRPATRITNTMVVVAGDVVNDGAVTNTLVEGLNLVSYPYNIDINLTNMALKTQGASGSGVLSADLVQIFDPTSQRYIRYWLKTLDKNWHKEATGNPVATNVIVRQGVGFFYYRKASAGTFNWIENRPYTL